MNNRRHNSKPLTRLVNLLLLLGWLLSSHGIAPTVCLVAALIDGEHAVKAGRTLDGALTVVLSHEGKSKAELTTHEHDALCRMLVAFAAAPSAGAADHVLAFKRVEDASRSQRLQASTPDFGKAPLPSQILAFHPAKRVSAEGPARLMPRVLGSHSPALLPGMAVMRC